jgi:hypothetical protein
VKRQHHLLAECILKTSDDRQYAPATLRNRDVILDVLRDVVPMTGVILEIASGSGEHVVHFARNLLSLVFQPSDPDPDARLSVAAWVKTTGVSNVRTSCPGRVGTGLADRVSPRDHLHQHGSHFPLGGEARTDASGRRDTIFRSAALSLRSVYMWGVRNGAEQPSLRPEPLRSRSELGSARPRSGCRDCALRRISPPVITEMPANNLSLVFRRL